MSSLAPRPASLQFDRCEASDLDDVMGIMTIAFDPEFGESWTRSQCAGILPMSGVALTLARAGTSAQPLGFSLLRTVADEAELLLIAVAPSFRGQGMRQVVARGAFTLKFGTGTKRSPCIGLRDSKWPVADVFIIVVPMVANMTR